MHTYLKAEGILSLYYVKICFASIIHVPYIVVLYACFIFYEIFVLFQYVL